MIKEGINRLNIFYSKHMMHGINNDFPDGFDVYLAIQAIENFGGIYGFRATMFPYIPFEKQQLLLRVMRRSDLHFMQHLLSHAREVEHDLRRYSPRLETWQEQQNKKWQTQL